MPSGNESCLSLEIFHFHIEYHMASHLLEGRRRVFIVSKHLEGYPYLVHFLSYRVLPESISCFVVDSDAIVVCFRHFDAKLVCALVVALINRSDYAVSLPLRERNPPREGGLDVESMEDGIISYLHRVRLF